MGVKTRESGGKALSRRRQTGVRWLGPRRRDNFFRF